MSLSAVPSPGASPFCVVHDVGDRESNAKDADAQQRQNDEYLFAPADGTD
ncbi:hypothetical protein [Streptomyces sp. I05A-00742]|nr:hypothetical protein [Streptomyces sp. I05A-00742]